MSHARTLITATTALLVSLGSLTACGPETPAQTPSSSAPSASATPTGAQPKPTAASPAGASAAGNTFPDSAWIHAVDLPMYTAYHWPALGTVAKPVNSPKFEVEELCKSGLPKDIGYAVQAPAAKAQVGSGGNEDWLEQETIVRQPGKDSAAVQTASALMRALEQEVKDCGKTAPGAKVQVLSEAPDMMAAVITIPESTGATLTLHEYLQSRPGGTAVAELAAWSAPHAGGKPKVAWDGSDPAVLGGVEGPLCDAFKECS